MRVGRPGSPELIALAGALLLVVGLFLPWYETDPGNRIATVAGARRPEMTAVLAMVGLALVLYVGVIARPGQPAGAVSLGVGWYLAAFACILECAGGAVRAGSTERPRKPPGVL